MSARMVWAADPPLWSATDPSCGWVLPSLAGMFATSPMTSTPGNPATVKSGPTSIRPPRPCGKPAGARDRRGHQAAAPDHAAGLDRAPVGQGHVTRTDGLDADPQAKLDAVLLEDPRRVGVTLVEEHLQELRAVVDEMDLGAWRELGELVEHRRVDHLGQGAGDFDTGRSATDDHEIDGAFVGEARVRVGLLEGLDDPRLRGGPRRRASRAERRVPRRAYRRSSAGSRRPARGSRRCRSRRGASSRSWSRDRWPRPRRAWCRSPRTPPRSCAAG